MSRIRMAELITLDYDDLLLYWAQMMCEPAIAADVSARFDHVLVDEYQDTNRLQACILLCLKPDGRGLTVVGDDAQSIYSFRAATVRNILNFPAQFCPPAFVKYGGLKFLDSAHVKDVLACLRWAENPRDRVAGFRVLQLLPGVGPSIAGKILDQIDGVASALAEVDPPSRAVVEWRSFTNLMERLFRRAAAWPTEISDVRHWYQPHLERIYEDGALRATDLIQLEQIAAAYPSRERFLTELTLDPPGATSGEAGVPLLDEDYLILSTIHSAKGQDGRRSMY